uniref:Uncharacterized protein n=1 Tax=Arundo donax TaxID=35708 RepID=A0A0A8ZK90_ARUDO
MIETHTRQPKTKQHHTLLL